MRVPHANDAIVGPYVDGKVEVKMYGALTPYIKGLNRRVLTEKCVMESRVDADQSTIVFTVVSASGWDLPEQMRMRIRNRCRDYYYDATGEPSNTGGEAGSYVDLVEHVEHVPII